MGSSSGGLEWGPCFVEFFLRTTERPDSYRGLMGLETSSMLAPINPRGLLSSPPERRDSLDRPRSWVLEAVSIGRAVVKAAAAHWYVALKIGRCEGHAQAERVRSCVPQVRA